MMSDGTLMRTALEPDRCVVPIAAPARGAVQMSEAIHRLRLSDRSFRDAAGVQRRPRDGGFVHTYVIGCHPRAREPALELLPARGPRDPVDPAGRLDRLLEVVDDEP